LIKKIILKFSTIVKVFKTIKAIKVFKIFKVLKVSINNT